MGDVNINFHFDLDGLPEHVQDAVKTIIMALMAQHAALSAQRPRDPVGAEPNAQAAADQTTPSEEGA